MTNDIIIRNFPSTKTHSLHALNNKGRKIKGDFCCFYYEKEIDGKPAYKSRTCFKLSHNWQNSVTITDLTDIFYQDDWNYYNNKSHIDSTHIQK